MTIDWSSSLSIKPYRVTLSSKPVGRCSIPNVLMFIFKPILIFDRCGSGVRRCVPNSSVNAGWRNNPLMTLKKSVSSSKRPTGENNDLITAWRSSVVPGNERRRRSLSRMRLVFFMTSDPSVMSRLLWLKNEYSTGRITKNKYAEQSTAFFSRSNRRVQS